MFVCLSVSLFIFDLFTYLLRQTEPLLTLVQYLNVAFYSLAPVVSTQLGASFLCVTSATAAAADAANNDDDEKATLASCWL